MFSATGLNSDEVRSILRNIRRSETEINKLISDAINESEGTAAKGKITLLMEIESFAYTLYVNV